MHTSKFQNKNCFYIMMTFIMVSFYSANAQTIVNSLVAFRTAVQSSNQQIVLRAGNYNLEDLPSSSRVINCSGSNNTIDMTGVRIKTRVGAIREVYFIVSGDNNTLKNGAIEDYYNSGLNEVTDFSAYNNDRDNLAYGLRGDPIMSITGDGNLIEGLEMIVKGSFPYGYGSQYGIGSTNTFGLSKRCGILITGTDGGGIGNTLDGVTMHHYAFGHGIFMQNGATETVIKNCYVEGRMRLSDDMYNDTETYDLPYLTNYLFPADEADSWKIADFPWTASYSIPNDVMYPLSEDGIRSYNNTGSVTVENCTVKQMRGGIRLYLASSATVINSKAIECGATNYNMPKGGTITSSSGDFTYAPLSDFRLSRSNQKIEMTIIPSPNAIGPHNIADILGDNHDIVFHRTEGPLDTDEKRAIVVYGDNSTIINETEYDIILDASASGNTIYSCGNVTDNGSSNSVFDCGIVPNTCGSYNPFKIIQADAFCSQSGIQTVDDNAVGYINSGDWVKYDNLDFGSGANSIEISAGTKTSGGNIEIREGSETGNLLETVTITNTGSFTSWQTFTADLNGAEGIKDIYFVFTGGDGYLFDVNWFKFSSASLSISDLNSDSFNQPFISPNWVDATTTIKNAANTTLTIYDINGRTVFTKTITNDNETLSLSSLTTGIYFAKIYNNSYKSTLKLIKK